MLDPETFLVELYVAVDAFCKTSLPVERRPGPAAAIASAIGRWKGASSHAANEFRPHALANLAWQSGYGVLTVSRSGCDPVREYVQNQRARHARRELYGVLERSDDEPAGRA